MRTRLFLFACLLAAPLIIFSQDEIGIPKLKPSNSYWGIGYYASVNQSIINDYQRSGGRNPGWGGSMEISYNENKNDLIIILSKNKTVISESSFYETTEVTLGPRFILDDQGMFFTEFTLGGINYKKVYYFLYSYFDEYYYNFYSEESKFDLGIAAGFGFKINVNKNANLIFKGRVLSSLPINNNSMHAYISASAGIVFTNRKEKENPVKKPETNLAAAIFAGLNSFEPLRKDHYAWSTGFGMELNYRFSPKMEVVLNGNYNNIKYFINDENADKSMIGITAGSRFYLNENPVTAFMETGGGIYEYSIVNAYPYTGGLTDIREDNPGIYFGTGAKIKIYRLIDLLLKSNMNFLFSEKYSPSPDFFTLQCGLRYNF